MLPSICETNRIPVIHSTGDIYGIRQLAGNAPSLTIWDCKAVNTPNLVLSGVVDAKVVLVVGPNAVLVPLMLGYMKTAPAPDIAGLKVVSRMGEGEWEGKGKGRYDRNELHVNDLLRLA